MKTLGVKAATPLVEAMVTLPDYPGESLHLVGLDPFTAAGLLSLNPSFEDQAQKQTQIAGKEASKEGAGNLAEWLGEESAIAVLRDSPDGTISSRAIRSVSKVLGHHGS